MDFKSDSGAVAPVWQAVLQEGSSSSPGPRPTRLQPLHAQPVQKLFRVCGQQCVHMWERRIPEWTQASCPQGASLQISTTARGGPCGRLPPFVLGGQVAALQW